MRKLLILAALLGVLAVPAAATAKGPIGDVLCCVGGSEGSTGCWQMTVEHSAGLPYAAWVRHYLVINYCKQSGILTSASIVAHGCDVSGVAFCNVGPAWQTGGGVGSTSASFEAHATWGVTIVPFYNSNDVLTASIPVG